MSSKFLPHFQPRAMQNVKATPLGASPPALREAEKNQQQRGATDAAALSSRSSCCFPPPARRQAASPPRPPRRPLSANCALGGLGPLGSGQEIIRQSAIIPLSPVASALEGTTVGRVLLENDL